MCLSLGDNKLFFGPKHNIYALFMIQFGLFDLILLFVRQICHVNCETENWKEKKIIFKKIIALYLYYEYLCTVKCLDSTCSLDNDIIRDEVGTLIKAEDHLVLNHGLVELSHLDSLAVRWHQEH